MDKIFDAFNFVGTAVFIVNKDSEIIFWNRIVEQVAQKPATEVIGKSIYTVFPHLEKNIFRLRLESVLRGGPPEIFSAQLHKYVVPCPLPGGELRLQNTMAVAMRLPDGSFCAVFTVQDVTNEMKQIDATRKMRDTALQEVEERKKIEQRLQQTVAELEDRKSLLLQQSKILAENNTILAQSEQQLKAINDTKDLLFSIIAHDLRSPLHGLIGFSEILMGEYDELTDEQRKGIIKGTFDLSNNLNKLIENLLQWAKLQSNKISPEKIAFNAEKYVNDCVALLRPVAHKKNIQIVVENIDSDIECFADLDMMNSVLGNFINNALKFSARGSSIEINCSRKDNSVSFSVRDYGLGMSREKAEKVFELERNKSTYGTEKERGSGLGLVLCKELILKNDGTFGVNSAPGKGSTFFYSIPANY